MGQVVVDGAELETLRVAHRLLDGLVSDPRTKKTVENAVKTLIPQVRTSEDEAEPFVAGLRNRVDYLEKKLRKREEDEQDAEINSAFDRLSEQGVTDDGIEKIKQLMIKRKIADPEAAWALWERQNSNPIEATGLRPNKWDVKNLTGGTDIEGLMKDPDGWSEREAIKVWDEINRGGA